MLPSPQEFLNRLAANPADAAEFDRYAQGRTRAQAVEDTLAAVKATLAENSAMKAKVAASKAKVAALEAARKSQSTMKTTATTPPPTAPAAKPAVKLTTAADYQKAIAPPTMTRSEFHKLTPAQRNQWIREGGRLA